MCMRMQMGGMRTPGLSRTACAGCASPSTTARTLSLTATWTRNRTPSSSSPSAMPLQLAISSITRRILAPFHAVSTLLAPPLLWAPHEDNLLAALLAGPQTPLHTALVVCATSDSSSRRPQAQSHSHADGESTTAYAIQHQHHTSKHSLFTMAPRSRTPTPTPTSPTARLPTRTPRTSTPRRMQTRQGQGHYPKPSKTPSARRRRARCGARLRRASWRGGARGVLAGI
ncbi:hypothetical protein DFH09DRAFT_1197659 [Mycena vulgaris]|nr:hypothetical protein DFH09DRAFT_1197659 [Mycena vulgaris]